MPLVFPGSTRRKSDAPIDPYELQFRDGRRSCPPHVVDLLSGIDTVRYTYEEAIAVANRRLAGDYVNGAYDRIISAHFREGSR